MADLEQVFSSQSTQYTHDASLSEHPASSPPPSSAGTSTSSKPKKPPPITPRRFSRFFTPRSSSNGVTKFRSSGKSGRQLRDITRNAINRQGTTSWRSSDKAVLFADIKQTHDENTATPKTESGTKRKGLPSPESSPIQPSPCKRARSRLSPIPVLEVVEEDATEEEEVVLKSLVRRVRALGVSGRVLQRSFGGPQTLGRGLVGDHCADWQSQTSDFYSRPEDCHPLRMPALPFCTASCHTNTLIAVGDETGGIRILESAQNGKPEFARPIVSFSPHTNAVMDMAFSSCDFLLATASGDQTARIIDMKTQQTRHVMSGHISSVKQVRFQPGNDNVLATSGRDGTVQLWDLRCRGSEVAARDVLTSFESTSPAAEGMEHTVTYASIYNSITGAHGADMGSVLRDIPTRGENAIRRGDISITALAFLPHNRSHLLLTASEASTSAKLWDIRARYSRRGPPIPISTTRQPDSHSQHRHFGINSLALSGDGARLYALSRDNTVYAYSTNHLILGQAPELSQSASRRQRSENREGLGPIYGFRHPKFHATTFYVKAAIRPAAGDKTELLAVGSSDGCAVLFPTDETFLRRSESRVPNSASSDRNDGSAHIQHDPTTPTASPLLARPSVGGRGLSFCGRMNDTIPICEQGTALVRGHEKEVTSLTWTAEGQLVSVGDDYVVRCWREGRGEARGLRVGGEVGGRRWGCGWAEVVGAWDEDE